MLATILGACSSSGSHATAPRTSTTLPATTTTSRAPGADAAVASERLLRGTDLPAGWRALGAVADDAVLAHLCPAVTRERRRIDALAGSPVPSASRAYSSRGHGLPAARIKVWIAPNVTVAAREFALVASERYTACVARAFAAAQGTSRYGTARVVAIPAPRAGDDSAAYRATIPTTNGSVTSNTRLDLVVVRRGRAVAATLLVDSELFPFPSSTRAAILQRVAARVRA